MTSWHPEHRPGLLEQAVRCQLEHSLVRRGGAAREELMDHDRELCKGLHRRRGDGFPDGSDEHQACRRRSSW